jgi:hypothetical protein
MPTQDASVATSWPVRARARLEGRFGGCKCLLTCMMVPGWLPGQDAGSYQPLPAPAANGQSQSICVHESQLSLDDLLAAGDERV